MDRRGSDIDAFYYSGRKITQDGQRDLDRIAMTLAEESDEE
jgi:ribosomal protein S19E (S16A)